ncbi:hypothetical protein IL38_23865 [Actinopolyspora erythraea]|uniref:Aminotransferase class I/classII large domain-containing protein n=1 Tax=Actinopolyspora erythraea TaxID=414996 RepID=A0ABR4WY75_9ACTN|nr:pyridoxal phosphate-dependent aminotransferase [Actinopolyspora erythraea]KGI79346.1 hypothetical protein IL38_23865 [Actinopolyspora erythraea]
MNPVAPPQATTGGPPGLQSRFDDLYTAVYAILDDAKTRCDPVKLYKGSHASEPHPVVTEVGAWFFTHQRGLLAYACDQASLSQEPHPEMLTEFDARHGPTVPTRQVFDILSGLSRRPDETPADFLRYVTSRRHALGAYRGGSTGFDDESRSFASGYLARLGHAVSPDEVQVFTGGFKGALISLCAAVMCRRDYDALHHSGGVMLTPEGYYQSLRLIPSLFGGTLDVVGELTGETLAAWLSEPDPRPRLVYVPLVNNATGAVLTRQRAHELARALLRHNHAHPHAPVYAVADDVYAGSYLADNLDPQPLGTVTGAELGEPDLGRMSDWTVTIVSPSKTVALPTSRIAVAATTNSALRQAMNHYRTAFSFGRAPQITELLAVAALCLTPPEWVTNWNTVYRANLDHLQGQLARINTTLDMPGPFRLDQPDGGWYLSLGIDRALFGTAVTSSVDAFAVLLNYGATRDSGVAMLPGELFGRTAHHEVSLRGNGAVTRSTLDTACARLHELAHTLRGDGGGEVIERALRQAHSVAPVPTILRHCAF